MTRALLAEQLGLGLRQVERLCARYIRSVRNAVRRDQLTAMANAFAVLGQRLVFLSVREPRLLVAALPTAP